MTARSATGVSDATSSGRDTGGEVAPIERARAAARAEIDGFLAVSDACSLSPPVCAALVRAWHALASVDALLRGDAPQKAPDFIASLRDGGGSGLPPPMNEAAPEFAARVLACALGAPWMSFSGPTEKELKRHRRVLLAALSRVERRARRQRPIPWKRRVPLAAVVGAIALTAAAVAITMYKPRWRVSYYANPSLFGAPAVVSTVLEPDQDWGAGGPGRGVPDDGFSARFETCLGLPAAARVDFTVGSDDGSRLFVDGESVIDAWIDHGYGTRQASIALAQGVHSVRLEYYDRSGDARLSFAAHINGSTASARRMLHLPAPAGVPCPR